MRNEATNMIMSESIWERDFEPLDAVSGSLLWEPEDITQEMIDERRVWTWADDRAVSGRHEMGHPEYYFVTANPVPQDTCINVTLYTVEDAMRERGELPPMMRVAIVCETSGTLARLFAAMPNCRVVSCDTLPSDVPFVDRSWEHVQCDAIDFLYNQGREFDLVIAHPPCTYLSNAGVSWLHRDESRWAKLDEGAAFFKKVLECPHATYIACENPIPHKYAVERIGRKYDCITHPYYHGEMKQKATCYWTRGLPALERTNDVKAETMQLPASERQWIIALAPSEERWKLRSKSFEGISQAIFEQWGGFVAAALRGAE